MGKELIRLKKRKLLQKQMADMLGQSDHVLIVHYSCESFYEKVDGVSPRVTAIAVRNFGSGQTVSFSLTLIAEEEHIDFSSIDSEYDKLEKELLRRFYEFIKTHQHCQWVHWNMRDVGYGFAALELRYRVLGGVPELVAEEKKFDLARAMVSLYGANYVQHPRLNSIISLNDITTKDYLSGAEEAEAFERREFVKLHLSTLRKVDTLANLFERAVNGTLKTNTSWFQHHGFTPEVLVELVKDHWIYSLSGIVLLVLSLFIKFEELFGIIKKML
ncbi:hypothetical protein [Fundidesulfovibrio agrisoli]|uniref:hypothetical protein n=1 Tax=Fundidesulfovibrio agrisoli TaxID=2922717 RepID=UPI001FAB823F|nr:hypothetical protein [Fundidesulfovibrio agrisoli]